MHSRVQRAAAVSALLAMAAATPAFAQEDEEPLVLAEAGYYEAPAVNVLVFSNWYDGLFADAKHSGVELVQQGERIATNGDVRLSATPGQWDPIGRLVSRTVDEATGAIEVLLEYPEHQFRYRIVARPEGGAVKLTVVLDQPLPPALAGRTGLNLEFLPSAYFHKSFMMDGRAAGFPLHPASHMIVTDERNAASGREIGPGAEPLPMASGSRLVLAPEDPARRVAIAAEDGSIALYDGRNQAQNGWFVARSLIPPDRTGTVIEWTLSPHGVPGWLREPVIGHSQLGYAPRQAKRAVIELDAGDAPRGPVRLLRVTEAGDAVEALAGPAELWGRYLRYDYATFDFSQVREPGLYQLEYEDQRTAAFRIGEDVYDAAWHPGLDVYMPVQMDHMFVNEAYRVWHGDPHRDDARQAPVDHEHIDLYRQGPTTDTRFQPGEHIPGMNVGGWIDAGDFDIRTQTQYAVVRSLVELWEDYRPARDQTLVDHAQRRVELHVPDGKPDILQQIEHGVLYLASMYDAVGYAVHGVVEPDVAQYTHLGDAASKTDGLVYDPSLDFGEREGERSGTPDDRWVFTSRSSALNYGSAAALAAASRALAGYNDALAAKALRLARQVWEEEHSHAPNTFSHGNTTGGWLPGEEFAAAVELLVATKDAQYVRRVEELWPQVSERFGQYAQTALRALSFMPASYRGKVEAAARELTASDTPATGPNPYGVPITTGGWAGNGAVLQAGLNDYAIHRAFPELSDGHGVFRALDYLHGTHPANNLSFVSGVGARSKEVAYGMNRADFSFIAGGVVPGVLVLKPDLPENKEDWPFFWGQNEYVVPMTPNYIKLIQAAIALTRSETAAD